MVRFPPLKKCLTILYMIRSPLRFTCFLVNKRLKVHDGFANSTISCTAPGRPLLATLCLKEVRLGFCGFLTQLVTRYFAEPLRRRLRFSGQVHTLPLILYQIPCTSNHSIKPPGDKGIKQGLRNNINIIWNSRVSENFSP